MNVYLLHVSFNEITTKRSFNVLQMRKQTKSFQKAVRQKDGKDEKQLAIKRFIHVALVRFISDY
jgi:hypothetical protein